MSSVNNISSPSTADAVGRRIKIFRISKSQNETRKALIMSHDPNTDKHLIKFDDNGKEEKVRLSQETFKWIPAFSGNVKKEIKSEPKSIFSEDEKKSWIGKRFEYTTRKGKRKIYDIQHYEKHRREHHVLCQTTKKMKKIQMDTLSGFTWVDVETDIPVSTCTKGEDVKNGSILKHVETAPVNISATQYEVPLPETDELSKTGEVPDVPISTRTLKCTEVMYTNERNDAWNTFTLAFDQEARRQHKKKEMSKTEGGPDVPISARSSKCTEVMYTSKGEDAWNKFTLAFDQEERRQYKNDLHKCTSKYKEVPYADTWNESALASDQDETFREDRNEKNIEYNKRKPLTSSTVSPIEGLNGLKGESKGARMIFSKYIHCHDSIILSLRH